MVALEFMVALPFGVCSVQSRYKLQRSRSLYHRRARKREVEVESSQSLGTIAASLLSQFVLRPLSARISAMRRVLMLLQQLLVWKKWQVRKREFSLLCMLCAHARGAGKQRGIDMGAIVIVVLMLKLFHRPVNLRAGITTVYTRVAVGACHMSAFSDTRAFKNNYAPRSICLSPNTNACGVEK